MRQPPFFGVLPYNEIRLFTWLCWSRLLSVSCETLTPLFLAYCIRARRSIVFSIWLSIIGSDILSRDFLHFFICPFIIVYLHHFGSIFFNKVLPARIEHGQVKINVEHLSKFAKCFGTSFFELIPFKMLLQKELLEDAERFTGSSADGSALTGPSPCDIYKKQNNTPKGVIFIWRRTWDSNPRGCYTLLDFQSSSLATRSILQDQ